MQRQDPSSLGKHPAKPHWEGSTALKREILSFEPLLDGAEGSWGDTSHHQEQEGLQLHLPATKQSCGAAGIN